MGKVVGGVDRSAQARRGFAEFYESLFEFHSLHPIQTYFGVDKETAKWIKEAGPQGGRVPKQSQLYPFLINIGGRGSSKTYVAIGTILRCLMDYPDNEGIIVRRHWNELQNSIIRDIKEIATKFSDGHPEYLMDGPIRREGYYEYTIFTSDPKRPSKLIIKPEPDKATDRDVADAFKGPQYGVVFCDELTQLRPVTWSTLQDNLRSPRVPFLRMIGCTNPPTRGHWLYDMARDEETRAVNGQKSQVIITRSAITDNPFLRADYVERMKEKYKDDPVMYSMYIEGQDGVDLDGTPVYSGAFSTKRNVAEDGLPYSPFSPIYVGIDFGWTWNVAVFGQIVDRGYLNILGELAVEGATLEQFGKQIQDYMVRRWPSVQMPDVVYFGDPQTATQHSMHSGLTTAQLLRRRCGIRLRWKKRRLEHGIDTLRDLLTDHSVEGDRPRLKFDRKRCPDLVMAMLGGYRRKSIGGIVRPAPFKDGFYDHRADAVRYLTDGLFGDYKEARNQRSKEPYVAEGMDPRRSRS